MTFITEFYDTFSFTDAGELCSSPESLERVQAWFNRSYAMISVVTAVPLTPVDFDTLPDEAQKVALLRNVYSLAYVVFLRVAKTVNYSIPPQFRIS